MANYTPAMQSSSQPGSSQPGDGPTVNSKDIVLVPIPDKELANTIIEKYIFGTIGKEALSNTDKNNASSKKTRCKCARQIFHS